MRIGYTTVYSRRRLFPIPRVKSVSIHFGNNENQWTMFISLVDSYWNSQWFGDGWSCWEDDASLLFVWKHCYTGKQNGVG